MTAPRWACAAAWWALAAVVLLWWLPTIAASLGALVLGRVRFRLVLVLVDALAGCGRADLAGWVCEREVERARRRAAALAGRRGW